MGIEEDIKDIRTLCSQIFDMQRLILKREVHNRQDKEKRIKGTLDDAHTYVANEIKRKNTS